MQYAAKDDCLWLGYSDGSTGVLPLDDDSCMDGPISCWPGDRHSKTVSALSCGGRTVWSGSADGSVSVWQAGVQQLDELKAHCELRSKFFVEHAAASSLRGLRRPLVVELRNGCLHFYADQLTGPAVHELDVCQPGLVASRTAAAQLQLTRRAAGVVVSLRLDTDSDSDEVERWCHSINVLSQLGDGQTRGLCRLATTGTARSRVVSRLECVGESASWSLSFSAGFDLTEWSLKQNQHGLDRRAELRPMRTVSLQPLTAGFTASQQTVAGALAVAPDVLWIAAGTRLAVFDTAATAAVELHVPDDRPAHRERITLMALVASDRSPSGFEVWTYAAGEASLLVWQCPLPRPLPADPLLIDSAPLLPAPDDTLRLTCLLQVTSSQLWAGTDRGSVIGWDVYNRMPLPDPVDQRHHRGSVTALASSVLASHGSQPPVAVAFSAGVEATIRQYTMQRTASFRLVQ